MYSDRVLRVTLISIILVLGSLLPALIIVPVVGADPISGETTFYFKNALSLEFENISESGFVPVSVVEPTKKVDSRYPPNIFKKNTSKLLPGYNLNSDELLLWITSWTTYFFNFMGEFDGNLSGLEGFELFFPHPYRVVEAYEYYGNETVEINGDVVFDLYFSSYPRQRFRPKFRDEVKVGLYSMNLLSFIPKEIKNTTQQITPTLLISKQQIVLENVNYTLDPGEILIFSIEIIPSDKSGVVGNIIKGLIDEEKFLGRLEKLGNRLENTTKLQELGTVIKDFLPIIEESNVTVDDIAEIFNSFRSSSFIYDSAAHPSSVTVEFSLPGEEENTRVYYLHEENKMNGKKPTSDNPSEVSLSKESPKWYGPGLERNKILKEGEAKLYIDYQDLYRIINVFRGKIKLTATLLDGSTEIASSYKELDRTTILALIKKPDEPMKFTFDFPPHEIVYGSNLSLVVSAGNETKFARFSFRRNAKLLYGSAEYPSSLTVKFGETDHIKFNTIANPSDEKIVPGGSVKYVLNITSKYDDDLSVDVLEDKEGDWKVTVIDNQLNILAGETAEVHIFANSTENQKKAYGDLIDMTFVVRGKTGIARQTTSAHVLEEAIKYNVNIVDYTKNKNIKKGRNGTFYFIIENNNTGAIDDVDSYTISASSKNNWEIMHTNSINNLVVGEKTGPSEVIVIVSIPKNTSLVSDIITFTVTSDNGQAAAVVNVTVNVIGPTILESIYEFFKSASNSLGFNEMFGSYGPVALGGMLMVIILFIIIILALLLTRRPVKIICTDRIKEIDPDDEAKFEINIENPTYKTQTYEIAPNKNPSSPKWEKSIEPEKVTLERHQSKTVFVTVKPTEFAKPKDWTETKIKVSTLGKKKPEEISTMTMVKEGETLLKITEVFTWPKEFRKGDRVLTSFKLENKGTITARNVDVILYINGKQKNKAVVTIPSGGYADIRMPWIAYKGKNKLYIKVREH